MRNPFLFDRNSSMRFHLHSYQTLLLQHDGCLFGKLTLWHVCDDVHIRASAYILNCEASGVAKHLVYDGQSVSLDRALQLVPVNLARLDGCHALTGLFMVDMIPSYGGSNPSKRFVSSGRQTTPLTEYRDLELGDTLGNAYLPLLRVPLEALNPQDGTEDVALAAKSPMTPAPQDHCPPIHCMP